METIRKNLSVIDVYLAGIYSSTTLSIEHAMTVNLEGMGEGTVDVMDITLPYVNHVT